MIIHKIQTWTMIFTIFSNPSCAVIDVLSDDRDGEFINMLVDVWNLEPLSDVSVNVASGVMTVLEFTMSASLEE